MAVEPFLNNLLRYYLAAERGRGRGRGRGKNYRKKETSRERKQEPTPMKRVIISEQLVQFSCSSWAIFLVVTLIKQKQINKFLLYIYFFFYPAVSTVRTSHRPSLIFLLCICRRLYYQVGVRWINQVEVTRRRATFYTELVAHLKFSRKRFQVEWERGGGDDSGSDTSGFDCALSVIYEYPVVETCHVLLRWRPVRVEGRSTSVAGKERRHSKERKKKWGRRKNIKRRRRKRKEEGKKERKKERKNIERKRNKISRSNSFFIRLNHCCWRCCPIIARSQIEFILIAIWFISEWLWLLRHSIIQSTSIKRHLSAGNLNAQHSDGDYYSGCTELLLDASFDYHQMWLSWSCFY